MRALHIIDLQPVIKIVLQLRDAAIKTFTKRNAIKLVEQRLVKPLGDAVGLR